MRTIPNSVAVAFENVTFRYGSEPVLNGLSLTIGVGERVALLGPNGSGKSTLLRLVTGAAEPESGSVTVEAGGVAFVPQRSAVTDSVPITVRETVQMGRWATRGMMGRLTAEDHDIVERVIDRLGISDIASERLSRLSGGQRQRALIAQAIAQDAPVLLFDEPEAGLDAEAQEIINGVAADEVASGKTVIVATHHIRTGSESQRCVLLRGHGGGIVADGPPEEVLTDAVLASAFAPK